MVETSSPAELGSLPNKPLVEALFELRWETTEVGPGIGEDAGWNNLPFKFYGQVQSDYPEPVELPAAQIPEALATYAVRYQFRKSPNQWPLVQIGPGIMTVNETTDYTVWDNFSPLILNALSALKKSYNGTVRPARAELRYINASPLDGSESIPEFLSRFLHTRIETVSDCSLTGHDPAVPTHVNINMRFPLADPSGCVLLSFANGGGDASGSVIWQLAVRSTKGDVPSDLDGFGDWLFRAHLVIEKWFRRLTDGDLMKMYQGKQDGTK